MSQVGKRTPVDHLLLLELFDGRLEILHHLASIRDVFLEPWQVAAIELRQTALKETAEDELEVGRTHRQKSQQRETCPKVDGGQTGRR